MLFSKLCQYFEKLEATSSRLALIDILTELFKEVETEEIAKVSYLIQSRVAPFYEPLEIGMAERTIAASIARAYGVERKDVLKEYGQVGDLGIVAEKLKTQNSNVKSTSQNSKFSVIDVFNTLREIAQISGEFTFTADARNAWTDYYINKLVNVPFEPEVVANFKARMPAHIFKCAMAFTVSETDTLVINRTNLFNAIQLVEDVKNNLGKTFRGVGESPLAASKDRIETYLERRSSATFNDITKHNSQHVREKDLEEVLRSLVRSGFCKVLPTTTGNEDDRTYIYLKPPTIIQSKGIVIP